ncbi:hypothetical protein H0X06_03930 [Candidatus Dependentiae bacterium]|nr:hypothetical protein [Candidatus Dependentiae bacterium]
MKKHLIGIVLGCSFLNGQVQKQSFTFVEEELINNVIFVHETIIENAVKKEYFSIEGKSVAPHEFEDQILHAEKEESKKKRQRKQVERLKLHETKYRGSVKISQKDLDETLTELEIELNRLMDDRLKAFMLYSPSTTLSSEEELLAFKEADLPEAKKWCEKSPENIDITQLQSILATMKNAIVTIREMYVATVNNAIEKADDTKLLKELLSRI